MATGNAAMSIYHSHLLSIDIRIQTDNRKVCMYDTSWHQRTKYYISLTCSSSHSHRASPTLGSRASWRVGPTLAQGTRYYTRYQPLFANVIR